MREHDEQQPDQDEAQAVTVTAGLATATGAVKPDEAPAETPEPEDGDA